MQRRLKERLIGAAVLVMLAVIFIPMILDDSAQMETTITGSNIPERPKTDFSSRIVPLNTTSESSVKESVIPEKEAGTNQAVPIVSAEQEPALSAKESDQPVTQEKKLPVIPNPENVGITAWVVQLGSFTSEDNANALNEKLRKSGFTAFVEPLKQGSKIQYRVRVGPELKRSDALALQDKLEKTMKLDAIVLQYP